MSRTVLTGIAKPMPTLPWFWSPPVWICDVTPITRPAASISGPPELPWLIAASVWIALSIGDAVRREDLALDGADDAGRERPREPERVADRVDRVADADGVGVPERQRRQRARVRVDLEHGEVGRAVLADDRRRAAGPGRERDLHLLRALDHVEVRDDVTGAVEHEAGAERLRRLRRRGKRLNGSGADWVTLVAVICTTPGPSWR